MALIAAISSSDPGAALAAITPIAAVNSGSAISLDQLTKSGVFTPPVQQFASLIYASTTDAATKRGDFPDHTVTEFPHTIPAVMVVSLWKRREKEKSAVVSVATFDSRNQKRGESDPKKVPLGDSLYRLVNSISVAPLEPGSFRVELRVDGNPVWRKFIKVLE